MRVRVRLCVCVRARVAFLENAATLREEIHVLQCKKERDDEEFPHPTSHDPWRCNFRANKSPFPRNE